MTRRYHLEVYGCQMNVADGELIAGLLEREGWRRTAEATEADLIVVNTCAVRERAAERVIGRIQSLRSLKRKRPELRIALVGCLARYGGEDLAARLPEVDLFLGPDAYRQLPHLLRGDERGPAFALQSDRGETYEGLAPARGAGVNAWISIMRGCDRMCTYCMVPFARGREHSLPAEAVLTAAREAVAEGHPALTLLGQTVTSYRDGERDFAWLLEQLAGLPGVRRIRFLSPHPADFTARLLAVIAAHPQVCRHFHLPLQSGSDGILAAMRRGYTREAYLALVADARRLLPGIAITTDLIVGFPGETERDFEETLEVMGAVEFDQAFMFAYSPRPRTYAARKLADDVPAALKRARLEKMIALQEQHSRGAYTRLIGRIVEVMIEGPARTPPGHLFGRSDGFKDVIVADCEPAPRVGEVVRVVVTGASSHTLLGRGVGRVAD
ncbi:MAG: tRNA (N6-isopentenyl adenosine(37)-C2)-methylthiotransferase MiaB [Candidatus Eisenbacteria sp.]|nr:tRNA (N6-isopentenyl adenosine(37)-C2)-methylthiotransferase MiaB [Candidatus Eisenbacteria bacterium]